MFELYDFQKSLACGAESQRPSVFEQLLLNHMHKKDPEYQPPGILQRGEARLTHIRTVLVLRGYTEYLDSTTKYPVLTLGTSVLRYLVVLDTTQAPILKCTQ